MSASAMPSRFIAAMMAPMLLAAASRAALTVGFVIDTPTVMRATSGMIVTLPLDVTVIVWLAGSANGVGAAEMGPACADSAARATTRAPSMPAPRVRIDWDIGMAPARSPRERRRCRGDGRRRQEVPVEIGPG